MEVVENLATDYPEMVFQTISNKSTQTPIPKSKAKEMVASNLIEKIPASKAADAAKQLAEKFDINGKLSSVFSGVFLKTLSLKWKKIFSNICSFKRETFRFRRKNRR